MTAPTAAAAPTDRPRRPEVAAADQARLLRAAADIVERFPGVPLLPLAPRNCRRLRINVGPCDHEAAFGLLAAALGGDYAPERIGEDVTRSLHVHVDDVPVCFLGYSSRSVEDDD